MKNNTKADILLLLREKTSVLQKTAREEFSANMIAEKLYISRSLASHYLNELFQDGKLVKVNDRPVLFLHGAALMDIIGVDNLKKEFEDYDELKAVVENSKASFYDIIGAEYSLRGCINQIKTAVHYLKNGLPFVLQGKKGSGKRFISKKVFEYCQSKGLISKESEYTYISCLAFTDDGLDEYLFGKDGILFGNDERFVVIGHLKGVGYSLQNKLAEYIDHVILSDRKSKCRLMFLSEDFVDMTLSEQLANRLLTVISIPSLGERTIYEKEQFVMQFIETERKKIGQDIYVTNVFMDLMISVDFDDNIDNLRKAIVSSFAKAYEKNNTSICLDISSVPDQYKYNYYFSSEEERFNVSEYELNKGVITEEVLDKVLTGIENYYDENNSDSLRLLLAEVEHFNDLIVFRLPSFKNGIERCEAIVSNIENVLNSRLDISVSRSFHTFLARVLYCQSIEYKVLKNFCDKNKGRIQNINGILVKSGSIEQQISSEICSLLDKIYSVEMDAFLRLLIVFFLKNDRESSVYGKYAALLVCHGYSTATSIARAVNNLVGENIFIPFDMPLNVHVNEIVMQLDDYLKNHKLVENVLILVDMGSLELIGKMINKNYDVNIGIINNITTSMVLNIGYGIKKQLSVGKILEKASEENVCKYSVIHKRSKQKVVIFTSESGMITAEKIRKLFENSLPVTVPLQFVSYDYYHLINPNDRVELMDRYEVLLIAGTMDPKFQGVDFIDLGDIVNLKAISKINDIFSTFMDEEESRKFNDELLKNFSLTNVIESVTILNPKSLLDAVEECLHRLERLEGSKIDSKIMVGLSVHVCCFVERMVMRIPVKNYPDLDNFEREHNSFIQNVRSAFVHLVEQYGIDIPSSEVGYIYDYIQLVQDERNYEDE